MRWSVAIEAEGDRVLEMEEIVELADAVAPLSGIASGIGSNRYGAQIVVEAQSREEALERGRADFTNAVRTAGLPVYPVVRADAISEAEDLLAGSSTGAEDLLAGSSTVTEGEAGADRAPTDLDRDTGAG